MSKDIGRLTGELRRRASAGATHQVALRRGRDLDMWLGCGYPKSGTVWLCHLMASAMEVPYPQNYEMPIYMRSVIHSHWRYDPRLPRTIYIHRDGRDVFTSLYFYLTKSGKPQRNPLAMALRNRRGHSIEDILGAGDEASQMLRLLEMEIERPTGSPVDWATHVREWRDNEGVAVVSYEDLLERPGDTLEGAFASLGEPLDRRLIDAAVMLHDFSVRTGRARGEADATSFKRAGVAGGWRQHFDRSLAKAFDEYAGDLLVELGYESDRSWVDECE
jgi:hypothetical protein